MLAEQETVPCANTAGVCGSPSPWAKLSKHGGSSTSVSMNNLFVKTHKSLMRPSIKVKMNTMFSEPRTFQSRRAPAAWNAENCAHICSGMAFTSFSRTSVGGSEPGSIKVWDSGSPDLPIVRQGEKNV